MEISEKSKETPTTPRHKLRTHDKSLRGQKCGAEWQGWRAEGAVSESDVSLWLSTDNEGFFCRETMVGKLSRKGFWRPSLGEAKRAKTVDGLRALIRGRAASRALKMAFSHTTILRLSN